MEHRNRRSTAKVRASEGFVDWDDVDLDLDDDKNNDKKPLRHSTHRKSNLRSGSSENEQPSGEDESFLSESHSETSLQDTKPKRLVLKGPNPSLDVSPSLIDSDDSDSLVGRPLKRLRSSKQLSPHNLRKREEAQPTRRSERTRDQPRRSMKEHLETDIPEIETPKRRVRTPATRENFGVPGSDFCEAHYQVCMKCCEQGDSNVRGPLVFCQGCTHAWHRDCLGPQRQREHLVTKVDSTESVLQCRRCIGIAHTRDHTAPHLGHCSTCNELGSANEYLHSVITSHAEEVRRGRYSGPDHLTNIDLTKLHSAEDLMFRCITCTRAWHWQHLPPRNQDSAMGDEEDNASEEQLARIRFEQYRDANVCEDCRGTTHKIETLVAWRPVNLESFIPGTPVRMVEEQNKEYLVKWKTLSHLHDKWMPGAWVWALATASSRMAFAKKPGNQQPRMTTEDAIPELFLNIDIVFDVRYTDIGDQSTRDPDNADIDKVSEAYVKYKGLGYEDSVWEKPPEPQDSERWKHFKAAYEEWILVNHVHPPEKERLMKHLSSIRDQDFDKTMVKSTQPSSITGGELMKYQLDGLNWLHYQWFRQQNAILADEMGLGKTIQVIGFLATMIQDHKCWPWLVIVPNSTCPNWRREVKKWVPSIRVVTYYGSKTCSQIRAFPRRRRERYQSTHRCELL